MTRGYLIGEGLRNKLKQTIARVDGMADGPELTKIPTRFESLPATAQQPIRIAAYPRTATWHKGKTAQVTFYTHTGTAFGLATTAADGTATALNVCGDFITLPNGDQSADVGPTTTMTWCIVGKSRSGCNVAVEGPQADSKLAAFRIADGEWQKGERRDIAFYAVVNGAIVATGETATAGNVSQTYYPFSTATQGTAVGPSSTMAWCVVSKNADGILIVTEAENAPTTRLGTVQPDEWQRGSLRYVTGTSSTTQYQVYSVFNHYSELDNTNGVVFTKTISPAGDGQTAHVVIGPPPTPMHNAVYEGQASWQRGETKEVSIPPSDGVTQTRTIQATNIYFDEISSGSTKLAIGKFGTAYHVISSGGSAEIKTAQRISFGDKDQPWGIGSRRSVTFVGTTQTAEVLSPFDSYTHLDMRKGLAVAKAHDPDSPDSTAYIVISPAPRPLYNATTTQTGSWSRNDEKLMTIPAGDGRTAALSINVTNKFFDTIDVSDLPVAVGKFGDQFYALTGGSSSGVKLADRASSGQWEKASQQGIKFQGTTTEVMAYNFVGHYEGFDGKGTGGTPGVAVVKGKELSGADGTAWYVISPPPITFRTGTFSGKWTKGQSKTITLTTSPTGSITVVNNFASVGKTQSGSSNCAMSKEGNQWYLIAAECE